MATTTDEALSKAIARKEPPYIEMTLKGHEDILNGMAFISRTRLLVTGSDDKTLRVWDLDTGEQVGKSLLDHDGEVWTVAASPNGRWIVSGGGNGSILVWEVATDKTELKKVPVSFKGHESGVENTVFAPDSQTFASASWDETVCVWKRETGKIVLGPLKVGSDANSVSYSPDGSKLAAGTRKHIIVWNSASGKELLKIEQPAFRIAFTPDGLRLPIGEPLEHPNAVFGAAFSEDSQLIATGCGDNLVRIWTVPLSESEKESQQSIQEILKKAIPGTQPCAPIPTSRFIDDFDRRAPSGRNNRAATTTRYEDGSRIKNMMNRLFSRSSAPRGHAPRPRRIPLVDVSATRGKYWEKALGAATTSSSPASPNLSGWNLKQQRIPHHSAHSMAATTHKDRTSKHSKVPTTPPTQKETSQAKLTLKGHEEWVSSVAFIPRTNLLVTSSADKSLRSGRSQAAPDGRWIVSGGWNGSILVWEVAANKTDIKRDPPVSFKGHEILLRGLAVAPDSETFASASNDLTICVWKKETGNIVLGPLRLDNLPNSVSYSPDGGKLAVGTDKHIIVWSTANGKELFQIEERAYRLAFTPDSLRLISGNFNDIRISDAATGDMIKQFDAHRFSSLAIAPNGTKFAITSSDKTTRFFDLTTFETIGEPLEHPDIVLCVAFSEDSQLIATGCEDHFVRTWIVPLSESEKELQQSTQKILKKAIPGTHPRPRRAPIPTSRFFDDFDTRAPPGHNNHAATTTQAILLTHAGFPLWTSSQHEANIAPANAHSGKRHLAQPPRPPPRQPAQTSHAGASDSSASRVIGGATPATLPGGSTSASATTNRPPSPADVERVPDIGCFAVLAKCFPRLSRAQQTRPSASSPH
ncbi:WD40-repeat-containing domain protein [Suillus lakei]|nr:WD40-repeat-containing domain protein [Suillus lakei]